MRSPFSASRQLPGRDAHRPADQDGMRAAVRELAASGLQPRDIAAALSLTEAAVRQLLEVSR